MSNIKTIPAAYATALFEVVMAEGCIERVETELYQLKDLLKTNVKLKEFLSDRYITEEGKKSALDEIFEKKISPIIVNQLKLMVDQGRVKMLPEMIDEFFNLMSSSAGQVNAEVISAVELTPSIEKSLQEELARVTGKKVVIKSHIDESILGGMIIKLGDKIIDTCLKKKLNDLNKELSVS